MLRTVFDQARPWQAHQTSLDSQGEEEGAEEKGDDDEFAADHDHHDEMMVVILMILLILISSGHAGSNVHAGSKGSNYY